ncbi:MAG: FAD:protein FMN transferase [Pseudomonadales bacterium]|nr:FAD:protein FMN transferase [Pseudomonadales bacterium]
MNRSGLTASIVFTCLLSTSIAWAEEGDCVRGETTHGGNWWRETAAIMGTDIRVELWDTDEQHACEAIAAVMSEMHRLDEEMSPFIETSTLSLMNREAYQSPVPVGKEMFDLVNRSLDISRMTGGAFDVTYASVGRYYDFRKGQKPADDERRRAILSIDYHYLAMNADDDSIGYRHDGVYVDLGGIAKGYAVDRGIDILVKRGITQGMVGAGGDSRILGDRFGEPWVVGIRDPRNRDKSVAVLPLMDVSVSTSGDYERYFIEDGVRYHHIIDPKTGDSARSVTSVTIIGSDATTTDALSTSVFVMGVERGLRLINQMTGVDAIIVDGHGELHLSDSLMEMTASNQ